MYFEFIGAYYFSILNRYLIQIPITYDIHTQSYAMVNLLFNLKKNIRIYNFIYSVLKKKMNNLGLNINAIMPRTDSVRNQTK